MPFNMESHTTGKKMLNARLARHPMGQTFEQFDGNFDQMRAPPHFQNKYGPAGGLYQDDQDGMMSGAPHNVGHHLLPTDMQMMHLQPDGCYLDEDGHLTPYDNNTNNSCFQYDPESQANSDLADSFVSSGKRQAKRARQREIQLIRQKHDKDVKGDAVGNRFCRQCCNGQVVPDYCSIF